MLPKERTEAIKTKLETDIPGLLSAAGLADFDSYITKIPSDTDENILSTYIIVDDDDTNNLTFGVIIHAQIPYPTEGTDEQDYHNILFPYIRENILPSLVDFPIRESIKSTLLPVEVGGGSAFILYEVVFSGDSDDCEYYD